jgi:hypothetical protein
MPNRNEAGTFFGSLAIVSALLFVYLTFRCRPVIDALNIRTLIIGPALFGFTFMVSVGTFPKAIFVLSAVVIFLGIICLVLIRLPPQPEPPSLGSSDPVLEDEVRDHFHA